MATIAFSLLVSALLCSAAIARRQRSGSGLMLSLGCLAPIPAICLGAIYLAAWRASAISGQWPRVGRSVREQFHDDGLFFALQEFAGTLSGFACNLIPMFLLILAAAFVRSKLTLLAWFACASCYGIVAIVFFTEQSATIAWWMV